MLQRVAEVWTEFCTLLSTNNHDPNTNRLRQIIHDQTAGLEYRVSQAMRSWQAQIFQNPHSLMCRSSLQLIEGRYEGVVNYVPTSDLDRDEKSRLERHGGSLQRWKCRACDFQIRYYVRRSCNAKLEETEDVLKREGTDVTYRAVFLAKSHLRRNAVPNMTYACILCLAGRSHVPRVFKTGKDLMLHLECCEARGSVPQFFLRKLHIMTRSNYTEGRRCDLLLGNG